MRESKYVGINVFETHKQYLNLKSSTAHTKKTLQITVIELFAVNLNLLCWDENEIGVAWSKSVRVTELKVPSTAIFGESVTPSAAMTWAVRNFMS
ncbi:hypothetical protein CEXT_752161 [Caerostris extrusa]|uniref:Uncharacterized protein n=1 Tax=Caerostris extrusa TaxID=172846 RepID=A0AAV4QU97_CAEEX|nr:hypothetical protein CEXT_752161 [Caerostris extrusa]